MNDFSIGVVLGFLCMFFIAAALSFNSWMSYGKERSLQTKCLYPVLNSNFIAEPYTRTCYSLIGDVKTVIDCKTVLLLPEFSHVKGCF
jgi:hypothetical protein